MGRVGGPLGLGVLLPVVVLRVLEGCGGVRVGKGAQGGVGRSLGVGVVAGRRRMMMMKVGGVQEGRPGVG